MELFLQTSELHIFIIISPLFLLLGLIDQDKSTREFIGQEPTQNHQNITPINTYETTTSNLETSHAYNYITTFPSLGTTDVLIDQG
ncbi:34534_t:CDS:2 [Gigaspora margarita]|uniref:34534_t:CDS:1 n=1 Tax=Gigaspora margarita TaxID=4874 RepID=A0ABN7UQ42_GIGMA|nr:34534_t:CDS:2 [Gigaspora margarita]